MFAQLYTAGTWTVVVTFNQQLQPGSIDPANWSAIWNDRALLPSGSVGVSGFDVFWTTTDSGPKVGPNSVSYQAAPADVRNLAGVPAAAFENFPMTEIASKAPVP